MRILRTELLRFTSAELADNLLCPINTDSNHNRGDTKWNG
jgi:hypothetical protein